MLINFVYQTNVVNRYTTPPALTLTLRPTAPKLFEKMSLWDELTATHRGDTLTNPAVNNL